MSNTQAEKNKRAAAGAAHTTIGRARVFKDRSKYNRKGRRPKNDE